MSTISWVEKGSRNAFAPDIEQRDKEQRNVKVIRPGKLQQISVYDILVGDIMRLESGDLIPVAGGFIDGHNVKCDESSPTGECDILRLDSRR